MRSNKVRRDADYKEFVGKSWTFLDLWLQELNWVLDYQQSSLQLPCKGLLSFQQSHLSCFFVLFQDQSGPFEAIQTVVITEDILEQLVSFDLSIIADRVNQLHFLTELGHSNDSSCYELNLIGLKVKGKIESHVSWLVTQDSNTHFLFDDLGCVVIEIK